MPVDNTFRYAEHIDRLDSISREAREAILLERARKQAVIEKKGHINSTWSQVVVFGLGAERYAIEVNYIKEVYPLINVTPLPCVPPWVFGVINVRRKIYSVVDLKNFFGLSQKEERREKRIIILEKGNTSFGILSDEIHGVEAIEIDQLQAELPTHSELNKEYLRGITEDRIVVLNGGKLLHSENLIVNEIVG